MKKIYLFTLLCTLALGFSSNAQVVISQVYGGGGNAGATYTHDFIELFNRGTVAQSLNGWSVQYASATGTTWSAKTDLPNVTLQPGQYFLIQEAVGGGAGVALPTPDLNGISAASTPITGLAMAGANGKVVLASSTVFVTGANPVDAQVVDKVGYGTTPTGFEGTGPTGTALLSTTSAQRLSTGCTDANNNPTDFAAALPIPRNTLTPLAVCSSAPVIAITSPANATIFSPETTNVNVDLSISNFSIPTGKIKYTINGGTAVYKTTHDNITDKSIAIATSAGQSYIVVTELVDSSNNPLVPAKTATVNFTVASYTTVADLATLRTQVLNGYYSLSSTPVTTHVRPVVGTGMATRNQKYIQDATGAILIDDATGVLNGLAIAESEAISGLKGQLTSFSSVLQLVPLTSVGVANNPATPVVPAALTFTDITANPAGYRESELVNLGNVTFSNLIGTPFAVNTNYTIGQGADTTVFRTLFNQVGEVDYIGTTVPTTADVIAIVTRNGATKQVVVRKLADMTNLSRNNFNAISGLNIYPNPAKNFLNITSSSLEAKTVAIYNVLGAQVLTANVTNAPINIASLSKGVYVVKVTEEGKTATRKLVIE